MWAAKRSGSQSGGKTRADPRPYKLRSLVVPLLTPLPIPQTPSMPVPGYGSDVFAFFSSRIGCLGSLLISVILTALLWLIFSR